jgi:hypothetical protein
MLSFSKERIVAPSPTTHIKLNATVFIVFRCFSLLPSHLPLPSPFPRRRWPRSLGSRQMNLDRGSMPMWTSSMPRPRAEEWTPQPGYPERSWRFGCNSLHRDPILSRIRLMSMMKAEPGALVPALGTTSSDLRLSQRQRSMTRR